jgi:hypothetical protein
VRYDGIEAMVDWKEFLGALSSYKSRYESAMAELMQYKQRYGPLTIPQIATYTISGQQIEKAISKICDLYTIAVDEYYRTTDQKGLLDILSTDWVSFKQYVPDFWDCDDYAWALKANLSFFYSIQIGWVADWSSAHSYNIIVFTSGTVALIEPQTDSVFFVKDRDLRYYSLKSGIIIY